MSWSRSRAQEVAVIWPSSAKPSRISPRRFELFHRSRPLWIALQVAALGALAVWTTLAYIDVIRSI